MLLARQAMPQPGGAMRIATRPRADVRHPTEPLQLIANCASGYLPIA